MKPKRSCPAERRRIRSRLKGAVEENRTVSWGRNRLPTPHLINLTGATHIPAPDPYRPAPSTAIPAGRNGSAVGTLVKILVGITALRGTLRWEAILAFTGGTIVGPGLTTPPTPPRLRNQGPLKRQMLELINQASLLETERRRSTEWEPTTSPRYTDRQVAPGLRADPTGDTDGLKPYMRYSVWPEGMPDQRGERPHLYNECGLADTLAPVERRTHEDGE